jgi:hypothetical protein
LGWPVGRPVECGPAVRGRGREWQVGLTAIQINFDIIQIRSNLVRIKTSLPEPENLELKYGFERFDERNNFIHRNFSRFKMDFKLKFRESII